MFKANLGTGSTFHASIPFTRSKKQVYVETRGDLSGIRVLIVENDKSQSEACRRYLQHWKSDVDIVDERNTVLQSLDEAANSGHLYDIVVIPDCAGVHEIEKFRREMDEHGFKTKPRLVVGANPSSTQSSLSQDDQVITLDSNPLRRAELVMAAAVASGRASPELLHHEFAEDLSSVTPPTPEEALEQGKLILLAEDNPINQDIIKRQLAMLGYACETANDGKQAYEMWQDKTYRLLLTDCHMPNWDGYQLTNAIRDSEEDKDQRSTIIAISANALQGEAEKCIAAGMDDYLTKPVEMKTLKQTLQKWMGDGGAASKPEERANIQSAHATDVVSEINNDQDTGGAAPIDLNVMKNMFGDDQAMIQTLLRSFVEPTETIIADLKSAHAAQKATEVGEEAHKLKSSLRTIGANVLADICQALEQAANEEDWKTVDVLVLEVDPQFSEIKRYVSSV